MKTAIMRFENLSSSGRKILYESGQFWYVSAARFLSREPRTILTELTCPEAIANVVSNFDRFVRNIHYHHDYEISAPTAPLALCARSIPIGYLLIKCACSCNLYGNLDGPPTEYKGL